VESLLGEGVDPHLYAPTRSDVVRLSRADVILLNGHNLEPQLRNAVRRLGEGRAVLATWTSHSGTVGRDKPRPLVMPP
jgi:manganese/zinc/iron transport system substrate-binding protein